MSLACWGRSVAGRDLTGIKSLDHHEILVLSDNPWDVPSCSTVIKDITETKNYYLNGRYKQKINYVLLITEGWGAIFHTITLSMKFFSHSFFRKRILNVIKLSSIVCSTDAGSSRFQFAPCFLTNISSGHFFIFPQHSWKFGGILLCIIRVRP